MSEVLEREPAAVRAALAGPALPWPAPSLGRILDAALAHDPQAPALVAPGPGGTTRRVTYARLAADVARRAGALAAAGVGAGDRVGLLAARHEALVPALLALLRVGAAYVPLDPAAPGRRWEQVAHAAGLRHLVGPAALTADPRVPDGVQVLAWEPARGRVGAGPVDPGPLAAPPPYDDAGAAAYVLFTSGSTGTPKGVVVTQANLLARCASYLALTAGPCRYLLHSSLCFDGAVGGLFSTLARGGCLVLPPDDVAVDPRRAAGLVARERVTHLEPVPSWYAALLEVADPGDLRSVTAVVLGGEVLPPTLVDAHFRAAPGSRLFNDYGPTETTVAATVFEVPAGWRGDRVPIGRPHANTAVTVVRPGGEAAALGEVGRLVVAGPCVAAGYLGDPGHPAFGVDAESGERTYDTGDLAALEADGLLYFHGRADRQVKIRGQRVEPEEVEAVLAGLPGVGPSAVEVEHGPAGPRLVAYVSPVPGRRVAAGTVQRGLRDRLPPYACPQQVVVLDTLPLTAGGKVDRGRLPGTAAAPAVPAPRVPAGPALPGDRTVLATATFAERAVLAAARALLGRDDLGLDDDFFALGGDSLLAARLVAALHARLGVEVPVTLLAADARLRRLVELVEGEQAGALAGAHDDVRLLPLRPGGTCAPLVVVARDGDSSLVLRHLLPTMAPDRPVWVLLRPMPPLGPQVPDLLGQGRAAARALLEQLPAGPVHLLGHSASGIVALEAARELGDRRGAVVLLDSDAPAALPAVVRAPMDRLREWRMRRWLRRRRQVRLGRLTPEQRTDPAVVRSVRYLHEVRAVQRTTPRRADFPVALVTAAVTRAVVGRDDLGWGRWCSGLRLLPVGGDHHSMLIEPVAAETVAALDDVLRDLP